MQHIGTDENKIDRVKESFRVRGLNNDNRVQAISLFP